MRAGSAWLGFHDGAASAAEETEERLGLARSPDVEALERDGTWWLYYEVARAEGSHELRLSRVPAGGGS